VRRRTLSDTGARSQVKSRVLLVARRLVDRRATQVEAAPAS